MTEKEDILLSSLTRLAIAISDEGLYWSPAMREAFLTGFNTYKHDGRLGPENFPYAFVWRCTFCDHIKYSHDGTGKDINCCNVTGQSAIFLEPL